MKAKDLTKGREYRVGDGMVRFDGFDGLGFAVVTVITPADMDGQLRAVGEKLHLTPSKIDCPVLGKPSVTVSGVAPQQAKA
jgi:hypothetical protein